MSIRLPFDASIPAIIEPSQVIRKHEGFPEIAISSFDATTVALLCEQYSGQIIGKLRCGMDVFVYEITYRDKRFAVYHSLLGGPAAAMMMEQVIVKGAKTFLFFGVCGTLNQALCEHGLVIPTAAYRDEGTSYHYLESDNPFVVIESASHLSEVFSALNIAHTCGKTWTTDAVYRETQENVDARKKLGCIVVEMECASLMAVAQFRNIPTYQFLYNGDNLDAQAWDSRTLGKLPASEREKHIVIALETAIRL